MPNTNGQAGNGGNGTAWMTNYGVGAGEYMKFYSNPDNTKAAIADLDEIARNSTSPGNRKCAGDIRNAFQHFLTHLEANPEADHREAFLEVEEAVISYWSNGLTGFDSRTTDTEERVGKALWNMGVIMPVDVDAFRQMREGAASPADDIWNMPESMEDFIKIFTDKNKISQMTDYLEGMGISLLGAPDKDVEEKKLLRSIKAFEWSKDEVLGENLNKLRDSISAFNTYASREGASERDKKIQGLLKGLGTRLSQVDDFSQYLAKGSPFYSTLWSRSNKPDDYIKNLTDPAKLKLMAEGIRAFSNERNMLGSLAGAFEELLEYVKAHPEPGSDMPLKKIWDALPESVQVLEDRFRRPDVGADRIGADLLSSLKALRKNASSIDSAMASRGNKREQNERNASARTEAEGAAIIQNSEWGKGKKSGQAAIERLKDPSRVKDMAESLEKLSRLSIQNGGAGIPQTVVDSLKQLGQGLEKNPDGNHAEAVRSVFNALKPFSRGIPDKACNALVGQQLLGLRGSLEEFLQQPDALEKQFGGKAAKTEMKAASAREKMSLYDLQNEEQIAGERQKKNHSLEEASVQKKKENGPWAPDVDEGFVRFFKVTVKEANDARGRWKDSPEYMNFYNTLKSTGEMMAVLYAAKQHGYNSVAVDPKKLSDNTRSILQEYNSEGKIKISTAKLTQIYKNTYGNILKYAKVYEDYKHKTKAPNEYNANDVGKLNVTSIFTGSPEVSMSSNGKKRSL